MLKIDFLIKLFYTSVPMTPIQQDILRLKREKNALILAHNYQAREILEIADHIGDSYELSLKAQKAQEEIIVFCGVAFQAEAAKLLNPTKTVLLPNTQAGCFMANRIDREDLIHFKREHPNAGVVAYINTYADIKAESDICCTSANAVKITESLPQDEIIFLPDRNLAAYVQTKTKKKIIPWERGFCFLHTNIQEEYLIDMKQQYPEAKLLMHPETPIKFHVFADEVLGTGGMVKYVSNSPTKTYLVATEKHMCDALSLQFPEKEFIPLMKHCTFMGSITLENTKEALEKMQFQVTIPEEIEKKARASLLAMMAVT